MKICIFTTTIDKNAGGPSRSVPLLAKGLSETEIDTTLLTCESGDMNTHILKDSNVKLEVIPSNISDDKLKQVLLDGNYDLIHTQNLWNPLYHAVAKIARNNHIPYMMTPRGCLEPWCMRHHRLKKLIAFNLYQKSDLQRANCILATSEMEANNIRNLGIRTPIAIIPNGIDVSEYKCRNILDYDKVKNQICFLSRIHEKKGIEFLIDAWVDLKEVYPDWNIVVAGNGNEKYIANLKNLVRNKGLSNCFSIIPPVFGTDKYKLYCESSLFVLPTYSENFGMVIAEAMSCGVPVITTNGTPWHILNSRNLGWCIDLNLTNLIETLKIALSKGKYELFRKGQECSQYINLTFDYRNVAHKNIMVYDWIINNLNKPKPGCIRL